MVHFNITYRSILKSEIILNYLFRFDFFALNKLSFRYV